MCVRVARVAAAHGAWGQLLMGLKIMDYSLLIGIHKHAELASPTSPDHASAPGSALDAASPGPASPHPVPRPMHDPGHGVGSDSDTEGAAHTRPSSDPGGRMVPPARPLPSPPLRQLAAWLCAYCACCACCVCCANMRRGFAPVAPVAAICACCANMRRGFAPIAPRAVRVLPAIIECNRVQ
jgi:hypothetical protein